MLIIILFLLIVVLWALMHMRPTVVGGNETGKLLPYKWTVHGVEYRIDSGASVTNWLRKTPIIAPDDRTSLDQYIGETRINNNLPNGRVLIGGDMIEKLCRDGFTIGHERIAESIRIVIGDKEITPEIDTGTDGDGEFAPVTIHNRELFDLIPGKVMKTKGAVSGDEKHPVYDYKRAALIAIIDGERITMPVGTIVYFKLNDSKVQATITADFLNKYKIGYPLGASDDDFMLQTSL